MIYLLLVLYFLFYVVSHPAFFFIVGRYGSMRDFKNFYSDLTIVWIPLIGDLVIGIVVFLDVLVPAWPVKVNPFTYIANYFVELGRG